MKKTEKYMVPLLMLGFLIGLHNGRIAIWKNEDPQPSYILPYRAELLPPADRENLQKGIRIENEDDLMHLIEDFCS